MENFVCAIDFGGTNFRIGCVSENNRLVHYTIKPTPSLWARGKSIDNLIETIGNYINENGSKEHLKAIAIGFPGSISRDKRTVYSCPNIKGFDNLNVKDPLEAYFSVPVFIENDVNFLLQHEITRHHLHQKGITLGFYIGTGFGNAIYMNDSFLTGKNGVAGELGHIPVLHSQESCACGNEGCIEIYASGKHLADLRDSLFPETAIQDLFTKHAGHPELDAFIKALAIPIATEINIFDPDQVIIGGGVSQMPDFPKSQLEACILKYTRKPFPAQNLTIIYAQMDQTTGMLGAGFFATNKLLELKKGDR